jgi:hypothetical protein
MPVTSIASLDNLLMLMIRIEQKRAADTAAYTDGEANMTRRIHPTRWLAVSFPVVVLAMLWIGAGERASAQDLFKWTDEHGVTHYENSVPEGVKNFERVTLSARPTTIPAPQQTQPTNRTSPPTRTQPAPQTPSLATPAAVSKPASAMSLEELDRICETAREKEIAPLRAAEIEECKASRRSDPAYCERFNATFGDAVFLPNGAMRPRMFNDLPECVLAEQERANRQGR